MLRKITQRIGYKYFVMLFIGSMLLISACTKDNDDNPITNRIPVIIDTDVDSDDAMTVLYLLNAPTIEVIGITVTGTGFMLQAQGVPVALKLAALGGSPDIPVSYGIENSLVAFGGFPASWRTSALQFYSNSGLPSITIPPNPAASSQLIIDLVKKSPNKVIILGLGPMTNIAMALQKDPSIINNIERIVMSAGAFAPCLGNVVTIDPQNVIEETASYRSQALLVQDSNTAEYNVLLDAAAFSVILQSGAPILISPLNGSQQAQVTQTVLDPLKNLDKPIANFIVGVIQPLIQQGVPTYFWDPVAASLIVDPTIATNIETVKVAVNIDDDYSYGTTHISPYGNTVDVCFGIDSVKFYKSFTDIIKAAQ